MPLLAFSFSVLCFTALGAPNSAKRELGQNISAEPVTVPEALALLNLVEGVSTLQQVLKAFKKMPVSAHPDKTGGDSAADLSLKDSLLFHTPILSGFVSNQYYTYPSWPCNICRPY